MKKFIFFALAMMVAVFGVSLPGKAASLWGDGNLNLYADDCASKVGDLLTVLIIEQTKASQEADTTTNQNFGLRLDSGMFLTEFFPGLSPQYGDEAGAQGKTSRSGVIIAQLTVKIIEILPAGTFLVEGTKTIAVNGETEIITLQGLIRPQDIERDNTIESTKLAEVSISYKGKGVIANKQRPSPLEWLLNWLF